MFLLGLAAYAALSAIHRYIAYAQVVLFVVMAALCAGIGK
jgi:hypothetical protein